MRPRLITMKDLAVRSGYGQHRLRQFARRGMPVADRTVVPMLVDEGAAMAWLDQHAPRMAGGPGRRPAAGRDGGRNKEADRPGALVENPLQEIVLSGAASPGEILRLAAMTPEAGGLSRSMAESLKTIAAASAAVLELRKSAGQLLDAKEVERVWSEFMSSLANSLDRFAARSADHVSAALKVQGGARARVRQIIADEVEQLRAGLAGGCVAAPDEIGDDP